MSNDIFFILKVSLKKPSFVLDTIDNKISKYNKIFNKYNKNIEKYINSFSSYVKRENFDVYNQLDKVNILNNYFDLDKNKAFLIRTNYVDTRYLFYILDINGRMICEDINLCNLKTNFLLQNTYEITINNKNIYSNRYYLELIINLFKILNKNGTMLFYLTGKFTEMTIELLYILSYLFKKVYLTKDFPMAIICINFLSYDSLLSISDIKEYYKHNTFKILPKNNLSKLLFFIKNNINNFIKTNNFYFKGNIELYNNKKILNLYEIVSHNRNKISLYFYINIILKYNSFVLNNKIVKVTNYFIVQDFLFIEYILKNINLNKCLEIGMTNILVLLTIITCKHKNKIDLIIDNNTEYTVSSPNANPLILLKNIKYISNSYQLILNDYLEELLIHIDKKINYYDLIYIDGYDKKIIYNENIFIYAQLLLKKDGIILISNTTNSNIDRYNKEYFLNNSFFYKIITSQNILCYKKII